MGLSACCLLSGFGLAVGVMADKEEISSVDIRVDTLAYLADDLPNGVEGKSYPIFEAVATDNLGGKVDNVDVIVYAPDGKLLPMVNGRFETATVGEYAIVYTATSGAYSAQKSLKVVVIDEDEYTAPYLLVNDTLDTTVYTGEQVFLPDSEYGRGIGDLQLNVAVDYLGAYNQEGTPTQDFFGQKYFIPNAEGEYVVIYTVTDIVGTVVTVETGVSVQDAVSPIISIPSVMKLAHVGETVAFPVAEAKLYHNGEVIYVPVKVYVNDEEITETMSYSPQAVGEYAVKYVAENVFDKQQTSSYEYTMQAIEATKESFVDNYMYLDGLTTFYREAEANGLEGIVYLLSADGSKERAEMQFKTPLHEQYLSVELGVETEYSNFEELYVTFTDSENAEEQVEIKLLENRKKQVEMYVNGRYVSTLDKSFTVKGESFDSSKFQFVFDPATNEIQDGEMKVLTKVEYTADGKPFKGFSSGKAYLSVKADKIAGETHIKLYRIATMVISNIMADRGTPLFINRADFADSFRADINDTVRVSSLEAFDLYDGTASVTTKITSPTGKTLFDGTLTEDYFFTATEYGTYTIDYTAFDRARNAKKKKAVIDIVDRIPPMIEAPELPTTVTVGTEFTFPAATVTDNLGEECITWVYVTNENYGKPQVLERKYTFEEEGTYVIKYGAMDKTGNMTVVEYTVVCVKGE